MKQISVDCTVLTSSTMTRYSDLHSEPASCKDRKSWDIGKRHPYRYRFHGPFESNYNQAKQLVSHQCEAITRTPLHKPHQPCWETQAYEANSFYQQQTKHNFRSWSVSADKGIYVLIPLQMHSRTGQWSSDRPLLMDRNVIRRARVDRTWLQNKLNCHTTQLCGWHNRTQRLNQTMFTSNFIILF